jgi:glycerophosphoryl diester phosphodiesterase
MQAKIYGHRGARAALPENMPENTPENTMEAFAYAASLSVAGIETDIAMTADFVPVLHHDPALPGGNLIKDLNFADLPPGIPSLELALNAINTPEWLLEIKTYPDQPGASHPPEIMVAKILSVILPSQWARIRILAFDWEVLRLCAARAPAVRRVCLTAPKTAAARELWWGPGFAGQSIPHAVAASGAQGWAGFHAAMAEVEIAEARALGLFIAAWTVNDPPDFARLSPQVDAVITDHPSRFLQHDHRPSPGGS